MAINFCFDKLGNNPDIGYPNLAKPNLHANEFDTSWPFSIPLRLSMYLRRAGIEFNSWTISDAPMGSWYPVALGWHDHHIDYFALMPDLVIQALRQKRIRVLFYYHEGDNPQVIKKIMDQQSKKNSLPEDCYVFVSANSQASNIPYFRFFPDHEYFFQYVNRRQCAEDLNLASRPYQFTALSRTHKWWRASIMSDMWDRKLLDQSQWSYNTACGIGENLADNPIRIFEFDRWCETIARFMQGGPYVWDSADSNDHNDHSNINVELYQQSYCHVVLETLFDADGSGGTFISEKTYKCFKYAQPFVIAGSPGTLQCLRDHGYRVFDHVLDNSYDRIKDNTLRWFAVRAVLQDLSKKDMHQWFLHCEKDLRHNQDLFLRTRKQNLLKLAQYLDMV